MKYVVLPKNSRISMQAHAFQRKEAVARMGGYRTTIREHLIKLLACEDVNPKHWIKELQNFVDRMTDFSLKSGSSIPKEIAHEQLLGKGNINLEASVANLLKSLGETYTMHPNVDVELISKKILLVYDVLAQAIADKFLKGKRIDVSEILSDTKFME